MERRDAAAYEGCFGLTGQTVANRQIFLGEPFWAFMPAWLFKHISMKAPVPNIEINAGGVRWWYSMDGGSDYRTPVVGWLIYGVF